MTNQDLPAFVETFRDLARVLPVRRSEGEQDVERITASYFRALKGYRLEDVRSAAQVCIATHRHFPKPTEWINAIPMPRRDYQGDARVMDAADAREWLQAERSRYEAAACDCVACRAAGLTAAHRLRFVPEFDEQDQPILAFHPALQRIVTVGHWAHGTELKRWYTAKATYSALFDRFIATHAMEPTKPKQTVQQRIDAIFAPKVHTDA